jgi:hypothetical protein
MTWIKCDGLKNEFCPCVALARWSGGDHWTWDIVVAMMVGSSGEIYDSFSDVHGEINAMDIEYYSPIPKLPAFKEV